MFEMRPSEHITDVLLCLHWLRVRERILFKVVVMTYRALHDSSPACRRVLLALPTSHLAEYSVSFRFATTVGKRAFPVVGVVCYFDPV